MTKMQRAALLILALAVVGGNCAPADEDLLTGLEPVAEDITSAFQTVGDRLQSVFGRKLLADKNLESIVAPSIEDAKEWAKDAGEDLQETFGRKLSEDKHDKFSKQEWQDAIAPALEDARDRADEFGESVKDAAEHAQDSAKEAFSGRRLSEDKHDKFSLKSWQDSIAPEIEDARDRADNFGDSIKDAAEHVHDTVKEAFSGRRLSEDKHDKFSLMKWQDSLEPALEDARETAEDALGRFSDATDKLGDKFKETITGRKLSEDKHDGFSLQKWQDSIAPEIEEARENTKEALDKFHNTLG